MARGKQAHDLRVGPRLSVISREPDRGLARMAHTIVPSVRLGGLDELVALLTELGARAHGAAIADRTLDLFGHATVDGGLLRLGRDVIDAADPAVVAAFGALGRRGTLRQLGIRAIRLLACGTAVHARGQATICALAEHAGVEVFGTRDLLYDTHYDAHGFCERWRFLLISASELRRPAAAPAAPSGPHRLTLAALPAVILAGHPERGPRRIATPDTADRILALVRGEAGGVLPEPVAPCCELALPAAQAGAYHVAHVVLGGAFVQFYPAGDAGPAVAYPVAEPAALQQILDELTDPERDPPGRCDPPDAPSPPSEAPLTRGGPAGSCARHCT